MHILVKLTDMLSIKPRGVDGTNEKLASIGVGAGIRHAKDASALMLEFKVLVLKAISVNRLAACSVLVGKVSTLTPKNKQKRRKARGTLLVCQETTDQWLSCTLSYMN